MKILQYLTDPGFWFATVLIGIVCSLFAAYLKDWISKAAIHLPKKLAQRRERKNREMVARIAEMSRDQTILIIANVAQVRRLVGFVGMTLIYLFFGVLYVLAKDPELSEVRWLMRAIIPVMGFLTAWTGYRAVNQQFIVLRANQRFRSVVNRKGTSTV